MSALQRSIRSRLLPAVSKAAPAQFQVPLGTRLYSDAPFSNRTEQQTKTSAGDAPGPTAHESEMISTEGASEGTPRHRPDYNVALDYRTS
jgi:NADH dehydrogenase (ubiquinone) Fe-S protein 4